MHAEMILNIMLLLRVFSYQASPDKVHLALTPLHLYYRLTRYAFGKDYQPFQEIEQGLHPVIVSFKKYKTEIRFFVKILPYIFTALVAFFIFHFAQYVTDRIGNKEKH